LVFYDGKDTKKGKKKCSQKAFFDELAEVKDELGMQKRIFYLFSQKSGTTYSIVIPVIP